MDMTLGFDASTTCVGWAFFNGTTIEDAGFIDISKLETNKEKALHVITTLTLHPLLKNTSQINLEAALSGFMGGRTSQQVIIKLARFNAVFEYIVGEAWKKPVILIGATTARKKVFGKARVKGIEPKVYVKEQLSTKLDLTKFDKINKIGNWHQSNADMYDAMVMSMA
jgi:uncharacterized membrane protein